MGYLKSSKKNYNPTRHTGYIQPKQRTKITSPDTKGQSTLEAKPNTKKMDKHGQAGYINMSQRTSKSNPTLLERKIQPI